MFFKKEQKEEVLARSSKAKHILSEFGPILQKKFNDYVQQAIGKVRGDIHDEESLACVISKLICIQDIENTLNQDINKAKEIEKEILNGTNRK